MTIERQNHGNCLYLFSSGSTALLRRNVADKGLVGFVNCRGSMYGNRHRRPHLAIQKPLVITPLPKGVK